MWLLDANTLALREFVTERAPPYAILSHRWGQEEVSFAQLQDGSGAQRQGWAKIQNLCRMALRAGLEHAWIDTCCIDKASSAELSEAINAMYAWYRGARVCFVYLGDVAARREDAQFEAQFLASEWFARGWTLQELLAPSSLVFVNAACVSVGHYGRRAHQSVARFLPRFEGSSAQLTPLISQATRIPADYLRDHWLACIAQKMSWAAHRRTTRVEDRAYCMIGLFNINLPLLYGEGVKSFHRLQLAIIQQSADESIFAWGTGPLPRLFANSPNDFAASHDVRAYNAKEAFDRDAYAMTNKGLQIPLHFYGDKREDRLIAPLNCCRGDKSVPLGLELYVPLRARHLFDPPSESDARKTSNPGVVVQGLVECNRKKVHRVSVCYITNAVENYDSLNRLDR